MNQSPRLDDLLASPDARCFALDPPGGSVVEMPERLGVDDARVLDATAPLAVIAAASHGGAVIAFEQARRNGHGSARVTLVGDEHPVWLDIVDLTADDGCFVAVFTPVDPTAPLERTPSTIAPRQASFTMDVSGVILSIAPEMTSMLGWTADDLVGESSLLIVHPDDQEAGIVAWAQLLEAPGAATRLRQRLATKDGGWLWVESTDRNVLDHPEQPHVLGEFIDVSREVSAEAALQRRETVLDRLYRALPTGVVVLEPDGGVAAENDRWGELVGVAGGGPLDALLARVADPDAVMSAVRGSVRDDADVDLRIDLDDAGACRHADLRIRPLVEGGRHVGLLLTLDDTTERRRYELALSEQMRRDPLTGVLNRLGVDELLEERVADCGTPTSKCETLTLLYLDLDDFKVTNDTRGHAAGDRVLREVADAIRGELDDHDLVARVGGDEFLVAIDDDGGRADDLTARLRARLADLGERLGFGLEVGASIGATRCRPGDDLDALIGRADAAMYRDKAARRRETNRDRRRQPAPSD